MDVIDVERPDGVVVTLGGQTPLKLARMLEELSLIHIYPRGMRRMDEKNEELVDAQIVEEDSRMYGHAEGCLLYTSTSPVTSPAIPSCAPPPAEPRFCPLASP